MADPRYIAEIAQRFAIDEGRDLDTRVSAAAALMVYSKDNDAKLAAFSILTRAMAESDWLTRHDALDGLIIYGTEEAIDALISALDDGDGTIRREAANGLAELGAHRAVEAIGAAWREEKYGQAREAMFQALKKLREKGGYVAA